MVWRSCSSARSPRASGRPGIGSDAERVPARATSETILVVDDDDDVRAVARQALAAQGYVVLETGDPQEAIRMAKQQRIDLLFSDVVMPLMKGTELADRIQAVSGSTKVLLTSGYQTSDIAPSGRPFLAKPFSIEDLVRRVRETLSRPSSFARPAKAPGAGPTP